MAERTIDRLLPQAFALLFGVSALAAGVAGIAADTFIGRPSSTSGVGIVLMFPLVLFAAIVGFALGHVIGLWLRRNGVTPQVPMLPYRIVMAFVLGVATVIGATFGARPVLRHERLHQARVIAGEGAVMREAGTPGSCTPMPATLVCDISTSVSATSLTWNGREVTVGCTREGRITVSDATAGVTASLDLTAFEYVREVRAAVVKQPGGREALAVLASMRATGRRHMLAMFDADGRVLYQELLQGSAREEAPPLTICAAEDASSVVVDLGEPLTYRPR